ncbi:YitT family protein [Ilumatobacter sp.]|uniref:YczE/YyaS/YitT family protein n=1 Tax=Ilumatobacter sp. TaxID=1967498 RepID=UPI0037503EE4
MSRHSALSTVQGITTKAPPSVAVQLMSLIIGSSLIGIAVALLVEARLGLAPYDVLASGFSQRGHLSLGQASWVIAGGLTLAAILLGRRPSRWGIAYMFLNGLAIDAASGILQEPASMALRIAFVPAGILIMVAGINVVLHSGTTGGLFELLAAAGEDSGVSAVKVRYGLGAGVLVSGVALGGSFGPATVVDGAVMGLTIMTGNQALADHRRGRAVRSKDEVRIAREVRRSGLRIIDSPQTSTVECDRPKAPAMRRPIMQVASSTRTTTQLRALAATPRATASRPPKTPRS